MSTATTGTNAYVVTTKTRTEPTATGRIVPIEGGSPPGSVGISEWDSLDDAVAFYKSKAYTDLIPQRDKAVKVVRRFVVEVEK